MPSRSSRTLSVPAFVVSEKSIQRNSGRQIDWANVSTTNSDGVKVLLAGTAIGDLLGNGKISPRVVTTNPAIGIMEETAIQSSTVAALTGYPVIIGGVLYENMLQGVSGTPPVLPSAVKTELNNNGLGFVFEQYVDSRAS